jgi:hypothetical protein
VLIDAEVGQVNEPLADIFGLGVVLIGGESSESFLEHVDPQWIIAGDHDVDPEIVLEAIDEMRIEDVFGYEHIFLVSDLTVFCYHLYPATAGLVCRLHDPQFVLLCCFSSHFEAIVVSGEEVGIGDEVVGFRAASSLFIQAFPHVVLAAEMPTSWEVVNFLEFVHILKLTDMGPSDIEIDIPLISFIKFLKTVGFEGVDDALVL